MAKLVIQEDVKHYNGSIPMEVEVEVEAVRAQSSSRETWHWREMTRYKVSDSMLVPLFR